MGENSDGTGTFPFNIQQDDSDAEFDYNDDGSIRSIQISTQNLLKRKNKVRRGNITNKEIRDELTRTKWEIFPAIENANYYGDVRLSPISSGSEASHSGITNGNNAASHISSAVQGSVLSLLKADEPNDLDYLTYGMTPKEALSQMQSTGRSKMPLFFNEEDMSSMIGSVTVSDLAFGIAEGKRKLVEMAQTQVPVFPTESKLSDCIPSILQNGFIYGSDSNRQIVQIYTLADLAKHLHSTSEMFLRVQEIENLIRRILSQATEDQLKKAVASTPALTEIKKSNNSAPLFTQEDISYGLSNESERYVETLTFAGYMKCFSSEVVWDSCFGNINGLDRDKCLSALNDARLARNKVMHISNDEIVETLTPSFECLAVWLRKAAPEEQQEQ
ncbi:CBS domain-containing protein [Trueperella abortisuis]|uniref:CBS domain-containing protein n=1 Tax=Trueperella abortisuis TaxID=445930 RepID=A0ABT9PIZ1_9ACTO|nr:hypothetical protein [Trueperella abortisuis]MDP9832676.1 hypothetical protein [Trueperella abortisuis]